MEYTVSNFFPRFILAMSPSIIFIFLLCRLFLLAMLPEFKSTPTAALQYGAIKFRCWPPPQPQSSTSFPLKSSRLFGYIHSVKSHLLSLRALFHCHSHSYCFFCILVFGFIRLRRRLI